MNGYTIGLPILSAVIFALGVIIGEWMISAEASSWKEKNK